MRKRKGFGEHSGVDNLQSDSFNFTQLQDHGLGFHDSPALPVDIWSGFTSFAQTTNPGSDHGHRDWGFAATGLNDGFGAPAAAAAGGKAAGGSGGSKPAGSKGGGATSTDPGGTPTEITIAPVVKMLWATLDPPNGDTALPTDTHFGQQWNLTSSWGGIDVIKAWQNYTGAGIKVGIVDDGIDYNHPDLRSHYLVDRDYDAVTQGSDAFGTSTESHGTSVAGVLAAARDGSGIVGVAYDAAIAGFRISYQSGTPGQLADALNHLLTNGMDVANASWGYSTPYQDNFDTYWSASQIAIQSDVANGRGGLGLNIVFAAGNGRASGDNVNYHNYQNSPYVITVAATDDYGYSTPFSNPGAALLVSAPGSWNITDDRLGDSGWSSGDYFTVAGTSYAAPTVSGVIALMLQANPNLGYRDVQEILAYSARQNDPTNSGWDTNGAHDFNGGGLHFSHDYGFGLIDATAAVRLAESWQYQSTFANGATTTLSRVDDLRIPDGTGSVQSQLTIAAALEIDKVVVDLNITHANPRDLVVTLTSPSGTTATLVSHPANGTGTGIVFETSANNFWGEDTTGTWTLTVADTVAGNVGTLRGWSFKAIGDAGPTPEAYIFTDEFATLTDASRMVLHDASGAASINTAAVTVGSYLDLNPGAVSTIAGRALQIASDTTIKNAWTGDGNDTIVGNAAGNVIQGGRGNDTIVAGAGADTLYGGPGNDAFVFGFLQQTPDLLRDFGTGDIIDLRPVFAALGYAGADPIVEHWLTLVASTDGGTDFVIDAHNGQVPVAILGVANVFPSQLHEGIDDLTYVI